MTTTMTILLIVIVLATVFIAYQFIKHARDREPVQFEDSISVPDYTSSRAPTRDRSAMSSLEVAQRTTPRRSKSSSVTPDPATSAAVHGALFSDSGDRSPSSSDSSSSSSSG